MRAAAALAGLLLAAAPARAAPPDRRLQLDRRTPRIEKLATAAGAVLADPPGVVQAELLPTGELLLEPKGEGEARVFLFARREVRVWEVAVGRPPTAPAPAPTGSCARPRIDAACHAPWAAHLLHLPAAEAPPLVFEVEGLQAQAKAAQKALEAAGLRHVSAAFSPFGVKLKGARDEAERRRALVALWPVALGPLRVDE